MKMKIILLTILFLPITQLAFSQTPTYTLRVDSMKLVSINSPNDAIEFGVYLTHTNAPTPFGLAGTQLFFSFNAAILGGCTLSDTVNCARYRIIGSQLPSPFQPRSPSVANATSPTATILRLAINAFQGTPGLDITGATNLLVVRVRLTKPSGSFINVACSSGFLTGINLAWRNPPIVAFATKVFAYVADVNTDITTPATHSIDSTCTAPPPVPYVSLKSTIIIEGLYFSVFDKMSRRDTIKTYLRNVFPPYSAVDSSKGVIDSITFTNKFNYINAPSGTYYIQVKHFNSIETWSKNGGETFTLGDSTIYNFTSASSQAYGNNLKLKGGKYCIYSGDVNQDHWIDGEDFAQLDNHAYQFLTGRFLPSDLNGDNQVDGTDFLIGDNNWRYIHTLSPLNPSLRNVKHVKP